MSILGKVPANLPSGHGSGRRASWIGIVPGLLFLVMSATAIGIGLMGGSVDQFGLRVLATIAILLLGVPHGAFDVALARRRWELGTSMSSALFLVAYVGLAATVLAIWAVAPGFALPCFLLVSGFHFAGDWQERLGWPARLVVGTAIITAPAVLHGADVTEIFSWLVPSPVAERVPHIMAWLAPPCLLAAGVILASLCRNDPGAALEAAAAATLALVAEPLCFFVIYFCGLHSIRHMQAAHRELRPASLGAFFALSWPYAPLAIVGTVLGGWWLNHHESTMLGAVFLALAALTAPHMLLVDLRKPRLRRSV